MVSKMDSQFSLRWNNYVNQITDAFGSLLHEEDLVDVTLCCEGKKIKAHKMLLSACSPYFHGIFKDNPCQHPVVVFRNVQFADLKAIVDFIYCGEVNVFQEQLESFLSTAEMLEVKGLTDKDSESEVVETGEITRVHQELQTGLLRDKQTNIKSRKLISLPPESLCSSSPPAKKIKSDLRNPPSESSLPCEDDLCSVVKEEVEDIVDVDVTDSEFSEQITSNNPKLGSESLQQQTISKKLHTSQNTANNDEEPSIEKPVEEKTEIVTDDSKVQDNFSKIQQKTTSEIKFLEATTFPSLKKRNKVPEDKINLDDNTPSNFKEKGLESKSPTVQSVKKAGTVKKLTGNSRVQIPKGLVITSTQATPKVQDLFDFPTEVSQVQASISLSSEEATTPVHEDPIPFSQQVPVNEDITSKEISEGEPEIAEEAPILEDQTEQDAPPGEEPEFDYFGCEVCRLEAKPVDLERLTFNHKCPICPCSCFCAHLLKEHMKVIHGWFNVQRRFTHY